jgi:hypothetical protein
MDPANQAKKLVKYKSTPTSHDFSNILSCIRGLMPPFAKKADFLVTSGFGLRMTDFDEAYHQHENGTWTIRYDDEPSKWYQYVAKRGVDASPESLRLGIGAKTATA